jgi:hypothetical protein
LSGANGPLHNTIGRHTFDVAAQRISPTFDVLQLLAVKANIAPVLNPDRYFTLRLTPNFVAAVECPIAHCRIINYIALLFTNKYLINKNCYKN